MELGAFSISLAVKDIKASQTFYEKLGFQVTGGNAEEKWLIIKNADHVIGLFEGMFTNNILTFNPGWNQNGQTLDSYTDIREIQKELKSKGIEITEDVDENSSGPASIIIQDPDGNSILLDQHI